MKNIKLLLLIILFTGCAKQGYPPGGPVDKRPPLILNTYPPADTTQIAVDTRVMIEFSEAVDQQSCQESIFITPFPGENIQYKWKKGRQLFITFPGPLAENRTYVITVGTGTQDRRNNKMRSSHSLAFSTGPVLDIASISGNVYASGKTPVQGTQIWAYDLEEVPEPNPSVDFPLYITQVGEDGEYDLSYMAFGHYRLLAIKDRDMNNKYDTEYDLLGVSFNDIDLSEAVPSVNGFDFRIALEDTTAPILRSAGALDQNHVDIRFSENMRTDSLYNVSNYLLYNPVDTLTILDAFPDASTPFLVHLTTSEQISDSMYFVKVEHAMDLAGHLLGPDTLNVNFKGSTVPDTTGPYYVSMIPADSSKNVMIDTTITLLFSEIMDRQSVEQNLVVADTLGDTLSGSFSWLHGASVEFEPDVPMDPETFYWVTLPVDSTVKDYFGNPLADTLMQKRFNSINPDTLSEIAGTVRDADTSATGRFQVTAQMINGPEKTLWIDGEGDYRFTELMPGAYVLSLFRDEDDNNVYSKGRAFPYQAAERFYIFPDTIKIRSRWPDEGENITLPNF